MRRHIRSCQANRMTLHTTESFLFGEVHLSCISSPSLDNALVVQRVAFTPMLTDGMAVDFVTAYRIFFVVSFPIHNFSFDLTLTECSTNGNPDSGEWLDAQSWPIGNGLLMIGTEDGETLLRRMPWLAIQGDDYSIEYLRHGFRLAIPYVAPNTPVGLHFVLAYNHVDAGDDSEWDAVNVPHAKLIELPVAKHICGTIAG